MFIPPLNGIHKKAIDQHAEMEMIPAGESGGTRMSKSFPFLDLFPDFGLDAAQIGIHAENPAAVVEEDSIAVNPQRAGEGHLPRIACRDGTLGKGSEVNPQMNLAVDLLPFVPVGANFSKRGHGFGVRQAKKSP